MTPPIAVEHVTFAAAAPGYGTQVGRNTWGESARCAPAALRERSDVGVTVWDDLVMSGVRPEPSARDHSLDVDYRLASRAALPSLLPQCLQSPDHRVEDPYSSTSGISMDGRQHVPPGSCRHASENHRIATGMQAEVNVLSVLLS